MIIEFFGISGVGKTTLAKKYFNENDSNIEWPTFNLYEKNSWFIRNVKKLICIIFFIITKPKWVWNYIKVLKKIGFKKRNDKFKIIFNGIFLRHLFNKSKNRKKKYLFDEGTFQLIWAIYLRTDDIPKKEIIEELINLFGIPSELNIVEADNNIIAKRLTTRGTKTKILETENLNENIIIMQEKKEIILEGAKDFIKGFKCKINYIYNN